MSSYPNHIITVEFLVNSDIPLEVLIEELKKMSYEYKIVNIEKE